VDPVRDPLFFFSGRALNFKICFGMQNFNWRRIHKVLDETWPGDLDFSGHLHYLILASMK
jgi:hypothetical protein